MGDFESEFIASKPYKCEKCDGKMFYVGGGEYQCEDCGELAWDAFGIVKKFLDKYGSQPIPVITQATGVSADILTGLLKDGCLQLPKNSKIFLKCEKCGCSIRSGRYCGACSIETFKGIGGLFEDDFRQKNAIRQHKKEEEKKKTAKMRFMDDRKPWDF